MESAETMLSLLRGPLKLNSIRRFDDLGVLRPSTIEKRLKDRGKKVSLNSLMSIYLMWARQMWPNKKTTAGETPAAMAKRVCDFLELYGCDMSRAAIIWQECVMDAHEEFRTISQQPARVRIDALDNAIRAYLAAKARKTRQPNRRVSATVPFATGANTLCQSSKRPDSPQHTNTHPQLHLQLEHPQPQDPFTSAPLPAKPSVVIDLTQDSWIETGTENFQSHPDEAFLADNMPPPESYVCKKCNIKGHWMNRCTANIEPTGENRPDVTYQCFGCGQVGQHYLTECPSKKREYQQAVHLSAPQDSCREGPSELDFDESCFSKLGVNGIHPERQQFLAMADARSEARLPEEPMDFDPASGEVGNPRGTKRARTDKATRKASRALARNSSKVFGQRLETPSRNEANRTFGRLSPWKEENTMADGGDLAGDEYRNQEDDIVNDDDCPRPQRSKRIANLEANNLLVEIGDEFESEDASEPPFTPAKVQGPWFWRSEVIVPDDEPELNEEDHLTDRSEFYEDLEMATPDDTLSSPVTPTDQRPIEFYVTNKSLFQNPLYHRGVISLFHNRQNVWVQKAKRPKAIDMWEVSADTAEEVSH